MASMLVKIFELATESSVESNMPSVHTDLRVQEIPLLKPIIANGVPTTLIRYERLKCRNQDWYSFLGNQDFLEIRIGSGSVLNKLTVRYYYSLVAAICIRYQNQFHK